MLVAVIMAGGKGERTKTSIEKPLIPIAGKPMIKYVIEALEGTDEIEKIFVATSAYTPKTAEMVRQLSLELIYTSGRGYVPDMQEAIRELGDHTVLTISADLPLITSRILKAVIDRFRQSCKPALSVNVPHEVFRHLNLNPDEEFVVNDQKVSSVGINVIEGERIDEPYIEQENVIFSEPELAINANDPTRLSLAEKMLSKSEGG